MKKNDYLERILDRPRLRRGDRDAARARPGPLRAHSATALLLKREDMQPVFSFKLRGAYNKMAQLPPAALKRGVIAASAGNHAQGVALAAQKLGCRGDHRDAGHDAADQGRGGQGARRAGGAARRLLRRSLRPRARARAQAARLTFVHPYDDPDVIAGQGTIGMEILRQHAAAHRRHLRADRRRRADLRHRGVREAAAPRDQGDRRGAGGCGRDVPLAQGRPARASSRRSGCSPTAWR